MIYRVFIIVSFTFLSNTVFAQNWIEQVKISSDNRGEFKRYGSDFDIHNGVLFTSDQLTENGQVLIKEKDSIGIWHTKQILTPLSPSIENAYHTAVDFGSSIALSGKYLVIGADKSEYLTPSGVVYIYEEKNGEWEFLQTIIPPNPEQDDFFGAEVAIDGSVIVVSRRDYVSNNGQGSVFIYELDGNMFTFKQKLNGSEINDWDVFGDRIAVNGDYIVASSGLESQYERTSEEGDLTGGAYVFKKDSTGNWSEIHHLLPPGKSVGGMFGDGLFLGDSIMFIGAPKDGLDIDDNTYLIEVGSVYQYSLSEEGSWEFISKITSPSRNANANFGSSISFAENRLVVSAPKDLNLNGINTGRIYSFINTSSQWNFFSHTEAKGSNESDLFGNTIKSDGTDLFIGSNQHSFGDTLDEELIYSGAIYHFKWLNTESTNELNYIPESTLFPNPSNGTVFIDFNGKFSSGTYNVVSMNGKNILKASFIEKNILEINLGHAQGVFFIEVIGNNGLKSVHRFVKTR